MRAGSEKSCLSAIFRVKQSPASLSAFKDKCFQVSSSASLITTNHEDSSASSPPLQRFKYLAKLEDGIDLTPTSHEMELMQFISEVGNMKLGWGGEVDFRIYPSRPWI